VEEYISRGRVGAGLKPAHTNGGEGSGNPRPYQRETGSLIHFASKDDVGGKTTMKRTAMALGMGLWLAANGAAVARAQNKTDPAAAALVSRAIAASDIEAEGTPAFRMEARMWIGLGGGQPEDGKLIWVWTPAGWWHSEMALGDYQITEISGGKRVWMKSTAKFLPFPIFLTEQAVNVLDWLRQAHGQQLGPPQTSSGTAETCVAAANVEDPIRYCFDPVNGTLARVVDSRWNVTFRYSDYAPFGTKSFPRQMEVDRGDESEWIEIGVVELAPEEKPDLRLFLPVKGAEELPAEEACGQIQSAKLDKMVRPKYPEAAEQAGIIGVVRLYVDIGADGVPRGMWPVNSSAPVLTRAAIDAVGHWRYRPRTCEPGGTKLPQIQKITVVFRSR
jgi:TonB family protein